MNGTGNARLTPCFPLSLELKTYARPQDLTQAVVKFENVAHGKAHELNEMLTIITGYAEFIRDTLHPGDSRLFALEEIIHAVGRASQIAKHLLSIHCNPPPSLQDEAQPYQVT